MRRFPVFAAAVFIMAAVVAGNARAAGLAHQPDVDKLDPIELTFTTMSVGSSTNVMTSNMVSVIEPYLPKGSRINVTTDMAGGAMAPFMISAGLGDLAIGDSTPNAWAVAGITPGREGQAAKNVTSFGGGMFYSTIIVIFAEGFAEKSGCTTLEELIEKKYPVVFSTKVFGSFGAMCLDILTAWIRIWKCWRRLSVSPLSECSVNEKLLSRYELVRPFTGGDFFCRIATAQPACQC